MWSGETEIEGMAWGNKEDYLLLSSVLFLVKEKCKRLVERITQVMPNEGSINFAIALGGFIKEKQGEY